MNREILFRGKSANTGEWVEGFCVQFGETYSNIIIREIGKLNLYGVVPIYEHEIVISETVGQYTGLKDKNGRKIFEGDIMRNAGNVVEFYGGDFCINGDSPLSYWTGTEVIGNIYDNPER